jgi:predicted transcriptional regulator
MDGRKTVEVRRRRVSAAAGTDVILYASSPVRAIVGTARLLGSLICSPDEAWAQFSHTLGLARDELEAYLEGGDACLLLLGDVRPVTPPLALVQLQQDHGFRPPQSYRYVSDSDPDEVRSLPRRPGRDDASHVVNDSATSLRSAVA